MPIDEAMVNLKARPPVSSWPKPPDLSCSSEEEGPSSDQENEQSPTMWKHSASKAADNLLRILQDIELDVTLHEDIKDTVKKLRNGDDVEPKESSSVLAPKKNAKILTAQGHVPSNNSKGMPMNEKKVKRGDNIAKQGSIAKQGRMQRMVMERQKKMQTKSKAVLQRQNSQSINQEKATHQQQAEKQKQAPKAEKKGKSCQREEAKQTTSINKAKNATPPLQSTKNTSLNPTEYRDDANQKPQTKEATAEERGNEDTRDEVKTDTKSKKEEEEGIFFQETELETLQNNIRKSRANARSSVTMLKDELEKQSMEVVVQQQHPAHNLGSQRGSEKQKVEEAKAKEAVADEQIMAKRQTDIHKTKQQAAVAASDEQHDSASRTKKAQVKEERPKPKKKSGKNKKKPAMKQTPNETEVQSGKAEEEVAEQKAERAQKASVPAAAPDVEKGDNSTPPIHVTELGHTPKEEEAEAERLRKADEDEAEQKRVEAVNRMMAEEQERLRKEKNELVENVLNASKSGKDAYYKVLGVEQNASDVDIKKAYRKKALQLHPDKDRYATPNADEAFKAVAHAYDVLKDPEQREAYDQMRNNPPEMASNAPSSSSSAGANHTFDTIPNATSITVHSSDVRFAHLNGTKGSIVSYERSTDLYSVKLDNGGIVMSKPTALFQNIIVCLRAFMAQELGVFLVTLSSYWKDAGSYQARYADCGRTRMTTLRPQQFIVPNGTVVRLEGLRSGQSVEYNGKYGTIVDWKERFDGGGSDTSYYEVQLSQEISVRVKMTNVCM